MEEKAVVTCVCACVCVCACDGVMVSMMRTRIPSIQKNRDLDLRTAQAFYRLARLP